MSALRRMIPLLAVAAMCAPASAHAQGGAGDDQYQDPFAGEQAPERERAQTTPSQYEPGLSEEPPAPAPAPEQPSSGGGTGATEPEATAPQAPEPALPNTGLEVPALALLGLGMLLMGYGLRLRTVDESLF
jgi:hypothetical protein